MKTISILFLLIFSASAFSQTAKKINKQLLAELAGEAQKQDSAYAVFLDDRYKLERLREKIERNIQGPLYNEEEDLRKTFSAFKVLVIMLKDLGFDPETLVPDRIDSYIKPRIFVNPMRDAMDDLVQFDRVSTDDLHLDEYKRKEQNELLEKKIAVFKEKSKYNEIRFQRQQNYIRQVEVFQPQVDSMIQVYRALNIKWKQKKEILSAKVEELKENYRLKGPKGFSEAYREYFPDIHPLPKEELVIETSDMGNYDVAVPPPVEERIVERQEPAVYMVLDQPAEFPGGMQALRKYLSDNLVYPPIAKDAGIYGKAYLKFVVSDQGVISNVQIIRGVQECPECDQEAIRLVKSMPKWIPGKNNGKAVSSYFNLPVKFEFK